MYFFIETILCTLYCILVALVGSYYTAYMYHVLMYSGTQTNSTCIDKTAYMYSVHARACALHAVSRPRRYSGTAVLRRTGTCTTVLPVLDLVWRQICNLEHRDRIYIAAARAQYTESAIYCLPRARSRGFVLRSGARGRRPATQCTWPWL